MKYVMLIIVVAVAVLTAAEITLPNYITPCKAKDEHCLKKTRKGLVPRLKEGIPELNIPSIDPVSLPDYNQTEYTMRKMPYNALATDVQFIGASNFEIIKFDVDLDALTFNLVVFFPDLIMKAREIQGPNDFGFDPDGHVLIKSYFYNITIDFSLNGTKYSSNKEKYIKWTEDHISVAHDLPQFLPKAIRDSADNHELELHVKNTFGLLIVRTINGVHEIIPVDVLYIPDKVNVL